MNNKDKVEEKTPGEKQPKKKRSCSDTPFVTYQRGDLDITVGKRCLEDVSNHHLGGKERRHRTERGPHPAIQPAEACGGQRVRVGAGRGVCGCLQVKEGGGAVGVQLWIVGVQ